MKKLEQLDKDILAQREENVRLFNLFQYKLHENEMQPLIKKWRDGTLRIKKLISQRNQLETNERNLDHVMSKQAYVNGYGEATEREITSTT